MVPVRLFVLKHLTEKLNKIEPCCPHLLIVLPYHCGRDVWIDRSDRKPLIKEDVVHICPYPPNVHQRMEVKNKIEVDNKNSCTPISLSG